MVSREVYGCGAFLLSASQVVLVIQKLVEFIDWSWWWVMAPAWMVCGVVLALGLYEWLRK